MQTTEVLERLDQIEARLAAPPREYLGAGEAAGFLGLSKQQLEERAMEVDPTNVAVVAVIALVFSLGATVLPSRQGARLDPAEGLRYE